MKKTVSLALIFLLSASLAACGRDDSADMTTSQTKTEEESTKQTEDGRRETEKQSSEKEDKKESSTYGNNMDDTMEDSQNQSGTGGSDRFESDMFHDETKPDGVDIHDTTSRDSNEGVLDEIGDDIRNDMTDAMEGESR